MEGISLHVQRKTEVISREAWAPQTKLLFVFLVFKNLGNCDSQQSNVYRSTGLCISFPAALWPEGCGIYTPAGLRVTQKMSALELDIYLK